MQGKNGWIKLNRKILNWQWYQDGNTFRVFLHLLLTANVEDAEFKYDTIHRGEVAVSIGNLAKSTNLTYSQVRTALDHLKFSNEIAISARPKYLVISIVKYNEYQDNRTEIANESQANRKQIASKSQRIKNIRNKEIKNNNIYTADEKMDYGGVFLTDSEWDELSSLISNDGEFIKIIDRVGDWLTDNPRPKEKHKSIVKTFMKNDGLI